jgi:hypothetical protein
MMYDSHSTYSAQNHLGTSDVLEWFNISRLDKIPDGH